MGEAPKFNLGGNDTQKEQIPELKNENLQKVKNLLLETDISKEHLKLIEKLIDLKFGDNADLQKILSSEKLSLKFKDEIVADLKGINGVDVINEVRLNALMNYTLNIEKTEIKEEKTEIKEEKTEIKEEKTEELEIKQDRKKGDKEEKTEVKEEKTEVKEEKTEVKEEKTEVKEEKTEVKEEKTEVKEEKTEVKEEKTDKLDKNTNKLNKNQEKIEKREKSLAEFNALTDELANLVNLDGEEYKDLMRQAENELDKNNKNLKNEVSQTQYKSYVKGIALLLGKEQILQNNPNLKDKLEDKFKILAQNTDNIPEICHIPAIKEIRIKGFFKNNPEYTTKVKDKVEKIALKDDIKSVSIENTPSGAKFTLVNDKGQNEIIEINKDGSINGSIEMDGFPLKPPIEYKENKSLQNQKYNEMIEMKETQKKLEIKELQKSKFETPNQIDGVLKDLKFEQTKNQTKLSTWESLNPKNTEVTKRELEQKLKEIEAKQNGDIEDMNEATKIRDKINEIKDYETLKEEQTKVENDIKTLANMRKNMTNISKCEDLISKDNTYNMVNIEKIRNKAKEKLQFLHDILFTKFDREELENIFSRVKNPFIKKIDFDHPTFGLDFPDTEGGYMQAKKLLIQILNQGLTGDKTKPIILTEESTNGNITNEAKSEIKRLITIKKGGIDYFKFETNLNNFNVEPKQTPPGEDTK